MASRPKRPTNPTLDHLRRRVRKHPEDPDIHFRLAVILMNPAEPRRPDKRRKVRACEHLSRAIRLRWNFASAHALLAYVQLELEEPGSAILSLRRAVNLSPGNEDYQDFLLEALDRAGRVRALQQQLEATARQRQVDLASLRAELRKAGLPTDPSTIRLNSFPAGVQHFLSSLMDVVEAIDRDQSFGVTSDAGLAEDARRAIRIDSRRVPEELRPLVHLAQKWGVPDDAHRGLLIDQASHVERKQMRKALPVQVRRRINEWLDSFSDASTMTMEASHFMYLLEAYEEM